MPGMMKILTARRSDIQLQQLCRTAAQEMLSKIQIQS